MPAKEHQIQTGTPLMVHLSMQQTKNRILLKHVMQRKGTATIVLMKTINLLDVVFVPRALVPATKEPATKDTKEQVAVHAVNYVLTL